MKDHITLVRNLSYVVSIWSCQCGTEFMSSIPCSFFLKPVNLTNVPTHNVFTPVCPNCQACRLMKTRPTYAQVRPLTRA